MDKRNRNQCEKLLSTRLKQEAELSRPAFSEQLHERICLVIEQGERPNLAPARKGRSAKRLAWVAAAAVLAVAVSAVAWQLRDAWLPSPEGPLNGGQLAKDFNDEFEGIEEIAAVTDSTADGVMIVDSALTTESWAYLDHDARVATELVLDQLPLELLVMDEEP